VFSKILLSLPPARLCVCVLVCWLCVGLPAPDIAACSFSLALQDVPEELRTAKQQELTEAHEKVAQLKNKKIQDERERKIQNKYRMVRFFGTRSSSLSFWRPQSLSVCVSSVHFVDTFCCDST
jgi:rRNA-processing protein Efg1